MSIKGICVFDSASFAGLLYICMCACVYVYFVCVSQLVIGIILNVVSAALAITAVVLYSVDLENDHTNKDCRSRSYYYSSYDGYGNTTPSPKDSRREEMCLYYKNLNEVMIIFLFFRWYKTSYSISNLPNILKFLVLLQKASSIWCAFFQVLWIGIGKTWKGAVVFYWFTVNGFMDDFSF